MGKNFSDTAIHIFKNALTFTEGISGYDGGFPLLLIFDPPRVDDVKYLLLIFPFVDRQTESGLRNKDPAFDGLEWRGDPVVLKFVVA